MKRLINSKDTIILKRAFHYLLPYKRKLIFNLVCIMYTMGTGIALPLFLGKIFSSLYHKNIDGVVSNIMISLIIGIFSLLVSYLQSYISSSLNQNIIYDIKNDLYKTILELPIKAFDEINNGELMSRLHGDSSEFASVITNTLMNSLIDIIRLIVIGITIITISWRLSLIIVFIFPFSLYIFNKYGKKIRIHNKQLSELNDKYFNDTAQTIWGIKEVKSLGIKNNKFKSFTNFNLLLKKKAIAITFLSAKSQLYSNLINTASSYLVIFLGGLMVINDTLSIEYFIAFHSYVGQFVGAFSNISRFNFNMQQVMNKIERIFFLIDGLDYKIESFGVESVNNIIGNIKLENVTFNYDGNVNVLDNITMNITANSKVALVGCSGSGKSTIFNLLLRFYDTYKGLILIDNINIKNINESDLRKNISVVLQDPVLFPMSIKENLLLAKSDATQKEIESVCKKAYIHDFIASLPNKYNTIIGENGATISGGQKQRIAIARALLKNSKIILFDEATSSLDNESQYFIKKAIYAINKDCTILIIAHRLYTIIEADNIYVMDKGKIVGQGNHKSLIKSNNIYKDLYKTEIQLIKDNSLEVI